MPKLLERLGVSVSAIHCTPNGHFPHNPEPLPEHLGEICELVKTEQADLGVVTDPDADRLALVDDKGRLFGEEYTQATAFDFILSKNPGASATNLSSSRICDEVAAKYGQECYRSAVGEINVVKKMQEVGAVIGGEGNGGLSSQTYTMAVMRWLVLPLPFNYSPNGNSAPQNIETAGQAFI